MTKLLKQALVLYKSVFSNMFVQTGEHSSNKKVPICLHYFSCSSSMPIFISVEKVILKVCIRSAFIMSFPARTINKTPLNNFFSLETLITFTVMTQRNASKIISDYFQPLADKEYVINDTLAFPELLKQYVKIIYSVFCQVTRFAKKNSVRHIGVPFCS